MIRKISTIILSYILSTSLLADVPAEEAKKINETYSALINKKAFCAAKEIIYERQLDDDPAAHYQRGLFHYLGYCGEKNSGKAFKEFELSARLGHIDSAYYVGLMYYFGEGVDHNIDLASSIFFLLLKHGHSKTELLVEKLRDKGLINEEIFEESMKNPNFKSIQEAIEECKAGSKSNFCIQEK
ncbi:tetratricopeptide repeat protein [Microbulbifer taiwanensis]|uniref:Tetratricopeptide repeat protein n=1 Tax=Microbulbifer taiwanensis TaxID=986746 RepID=A0ABW1YQD6_9GAMM|nr:sel1 repeat family protein [Microbulbifer taiwanensis]